MQYSKANSILRKIGFVKFNDTTRSTLSVKSLNMGVAALINIQWLTYKILARSLHKWPICEHTKQSPVTCNFPMTLERQKHWNLQYSYKLIFCSLNRNEWTLRKCEAICKIPISLIHIYKYGMRCGCILR